MACTPTPLRTPVGTSSFFILPKLKLTGFSSESVSLENSDAFFPFLNLLTHQHPDEALQIAVDNGFLPDHGASEMVQLNMGLHAATPKIEAFYQHYDDHFNSSIAENCGSWVDWYGQVVCDLDTLVHLAGTPSTQNS